MTRPPPPAALPVRRALSRLFTRDLPWRAGRTDQWINRCPAHRGGHRPRHQGLRREIVLTRAFGASRAQIRSTIRWEALLIAGFGLTAALATGVSFGWVLVWALADDGFRGFAVPAAQLLVVAAVTGLLTLAAAVFPAAWSGRRRILSAIADR